MESQRSIIGQLTQLLTGAVDKGKSPALNPGDESDDLPYPSGFTPVHVQAQQEMYT